MKAKRILSLALAAIFAVSALSGCDWLWWLEQQQAASSSSSSSSSSAPRPSHDNSDDDENNDDSSSSSSTPDPEPDPEPEPEPVVEFNETTGGMTVAATGGNTTLTRSMVIDALGGKVDGEKLNSIKPAILTGITTIDEGAFQNCIYLTSISMPGVTAIGSNAFYNCNNLRSLNVSTVTSIEDSAFVNCYNLTTVDARSVESIDKEAFNGCTALRHLALPADAVLKTDGITIGNEAFSQAATENGENKLTIYYKGCDTGKDESAQDDFVEKLGEAGLRVNFRPGLEKVEVNFDSLDSFPGTQQDKQLTDNTLARTILNLF